MDLQIEIGLLYCISTLKVSDHNRHKEMTSDPIEFDNPRLIGRISHRRGVYDPRCLAEIDRIKAVAVK